MRRSVVVALLLLAGCRRGASAGPVDPNIGLPDAGAPDSGAPDAGTPDAGAPDAGSPDAGSPDAGVPDAGLPDAGPPDAGPPDAGPPAPDAHKIGGLGAGPWPAAPLTLYGTAQGLLESPISASTDEAENLWVVSHAALYLLTPGARNFRRFTAADGLHVGPGWTEPPDITMVAGGAPGQCFVGYYAHDTNVNTQPGTAHTSGDPVAHLGKMDEVLLRKDGTLEVHRYDFHNTNSDYYWETRTIMSLVYDHFQHPGNLYVGSNHGITRVIPSKWRLPANSTEAAQPSLVEHEYYADHVHNWVCSGGPCTNPDGSPSNYPSAFGDFFGLTLAPDGRLWMAGLTSASAIGYRETLGEWVQSWDTHNPFDPAFGDGSGPAVFETSRYGEEINLRAVTVTPDGTVWFASGGAEGWRTPWAQGHGVGLAAFDKPPPPVQPGQIARGFPYHWTYFDPINLGAIENNILELQALPDGRLVLGFPSSGLLVWKPGDPKGHRITQNQGLPGESVGRISLDTMVSPPALYVPVEGGLAVFREVP